MHRPGRLLGAMLVVGLMLAGCKKDEQPAAGGAQGAAPAEAVDAKSTYAVNVNVPGPVAPGAKAELVAEVTAKDGFKINADYPHYFRPEKAAEGIQFEKERFDIFETAEKTACAKEENETCAMKVKVPFTAPASAGEQKIAGTLAISVCDPDRCIIEKVPVSVAVRVQ